MENYKKLLANKISLAVNSQIEEFKESENGFYCDFDIPPLNPAAFAKIAMEADTADIECAYELHSFSGVYRDGDAKSQMLQRIYVSAFKTKAELEGYKSFVATAEECDHKVLGKKCLAAQMKLVRD